MRFGCKRQQRNSKERKKIFEMKNSWKFEINKSENNLREIRKGWKKWHIFGSISFVTTSLFLSKIFRYFWAHFVASFSIFLGGVTNNWIFFGVHTVRNRRLVAKRHLDHRPGLMHKTSIMTLGVFVIFVTHFFGHFQGVVGLTADPFDTQQFFLIYHKNPLWALKNINEKALHKYKRLNKR